MGVSLWLVPSDSDAQKFKNVMKLRPDRPHPSRSTYPSFHPHITLATLGPLSEISLGDVMKAIPSGAQKVRADFASVEIGNHYFRSVYVAIERSSTIEALHEQVHRKLGIREPRTPSFPHLSLCYIDNEDAKEGERQAYYELLKVGRLREGKDGKSISLDCAGEDDGEDWISGFEASEIWVANCDGPVEGWTVLDKFILR